MLFRVCLNNVSQIDVEVSYEGMLNCSELYYVYPVGSSELGFYVSKEGEKLTCSADASKWLIPYALEAVQQAILVAKDKKKGWKELLKEREIRR